MKKQYLLVALLSVAHLAYAPGGASCAQKNGSNTRERAEQRELQLQKLRTLQGAGLTRSDRDGDVYLLDGRGQIAENRGGGSYEVSPFVETVYNEFVTRQQAAAAAVCPQGFTLQGGACHGTAQGFGGPMHVTVPAHVPAQGGVTVCNISNTACSPVKTACQAATVACQVAGGAHPAAKAACAVASGTCKAAGAACGAAGATCGSKK